MNAASPWDATRWRETDLKQPLPQAPLPSESAARRSSLAQLGATFDHPHRSHPHQRWFDDARSAATEPGSRALLPPPTEPCTDASTYQARPHERHTPPLSGEPYPQQLVNTSPHRHAFPGAWPSLQENDLQRSRTGYIPDAPLTLQIPHTQHLPKVSAAYGTPASESQPRSSIQTSIAQSTSLPSFASLQERTTRTEEADDGPEIAPMSSRLSCYMCTRLKPMVEQAAIAVAELDGQIQANHNRSATRSFDFPKDSPIRTVEWILERLRVAKGEMLDPGLRSNAGLPFQHASMLPSGFQSRNASPPDPYKRPAETLDATELPPLKRPRSGGSTDQSYRHLSGQSSRDDYRAAYDFAGREIITRQGRSPTAADSITPSAYPRPHSPPFASRSARPLPSPSSLAWPLSAAPSLHPHPAQSVGSPTTSYHPPSSIHTTSTSSATSQHIADLQHQVTLKSLALQTLQSEYSTLLQKLQRERVKSQTIEKKTNVADQEVNDLTNKNEDLSEQIKALETQLDDSEKKREGDRVEAQREKEQWGRMLEMGGRLQNQLSQDRQRLQQEKEQLLQSIECLEDEKRLRSDPVKKTSTTRLDPQDLTSSTSDRAGGGLPGPSVTSAGFPTSPITKESSELASTRREIGLLKTKVDVLRHMLEHVKHHNQTLETKAQAIIADGNRLGDAIDRALDEGGPITIKDSDLRSRQADDSKPSLHLSQPLLGERTTNAPIASSKRSSASPRAVEKCRPPGLASIPSTSEMAAAARASTPGPAELGIDVVHSTSSPEELIKALGPIPIAAVSHTSSASSESSNSPGSQAPLSDPGLFKQVTREWPFVSSQSH